MRRARWAAVALLGAAALTACGGGDGDGDGRAAPEPAPTVTVTVTETATPAEVEPLEQSPTPTPTPEPEPEPTTADAACDAPGLEGSAFIFVTSPAVGAPVSDGDTVEGCSNTFEATYEYELLDGQGNVLDSGFGTATCGSGCVGDFSFTLDLSVPEVTVGYLRVFASSAQDGSETLVNSVPVLLQP